MLVYCCNNPTTTKKREGKSLEEKKEREKIDASVTSLRGRSERGSKKN